MILIHEQVNNSETNTTFPWTEESPDPNVIDLNNWKFETFGDALKQLLNNLGTAQEAKEIENTVTSAFYDNEGYYNDEHYYF